MNKINKLCVILYGHWLSYAGQTQQTDEQEIVCMGQQCCWFDRDSDGCIVFSALKALKDKES